MFLVNLVNLSQSSFVSCKAKAGAKNYFYQDLKSLFIKSWCTYQNFDFEVLLIKLLF